MEHKAAPTSQHFLVIKILMAMWAGVQELQLAQSAELPLSTGAGGAGPSSYKSDGEDAMSTTLSDITVLTPSTRG